MKDIDIVKDKILVSNIQFSYHWLKYNPVQNLLYIIADDPIPRWLTATAPLDNLTIMGGDKFGNVFTLRIPPYVEKLLHEDPSGGAVQWNSNTRISGAPHKLEMLNTAFVLFSLFRFSSDFQLGETITKLIRTRITPGGHDSVLYSTINGIIGAIVPFQSREDVDFFQTLEMHMREEYKPLCGRDHRAYRSYYAPVRVSHLRRFSSLLHPRIWLMEICANNFQNYPTSFSRRLPLTLIAILRKFRKN